MTVNQISGKKTGHLSYLLTSPVMAVLKAGVQSINELKIAAHINMYTGTGMSFSFTENVKENDTWGIPRQIDQKKSRNNTQHLRF